MNRNQWSHNFIDAINATTFAEADIPHTTPNARALVSWIHTEGGTARWNPLNTTFAVPLSWDYNSVHVQNYPTYEAGLRALVMTILETRYSAIRKCLRESTPAVETCRAIDESSWGTSGLILRVLPLVKADYWSFASHLIAGS